MSQSKKSSKYSSVSLDLLQWKENDLRKSEREYCIYESIILVKYEAAVTGDSEGMPISRFTRTVEAAFLS